jgi:molybdenum cofactor cytidylyltransferase
MAIKSHIAIILLAAGASTRLGLPKQLLHYNGTTLLRRAVETALRSNADTVHVVLGFESQKMQKEISDLQTDVIINTDCGKASAPPSAQGYGLLN